MILRILILKKRLLFWINFLFRQLKMVIRKILKVQLQVDINQSRF